MPNSFIKNYQLISNLTTQFRFVLDSQAPLTLIISANNINITAFIGVFADSYATSSLWSQNALNGQIILRIKQSDVRFTLGTPYYLTIANGLKSSGQLGLVNISLSQTPDQTLLPPGRLVDRMQTPNDFVKYYYIAPPYLNQNFSA